MGVQRYCDKCGRMESPGHPIGVRRYTLRYEVVREQKNSVRMGRIQQSAGGIDLCDECWTNICKPRMNLRKSHGKNHLAVVREA